MINLNKKWLLSASPWKRFSRMLAAPAVIGGMILTTMGALSGQLATAQSLHGSSTRPGNQEVNTTSHTTVSTSHSGSIVDFTAPSIPATTGGTSICTLGGTTNLANTYTVTGVTPVWSSTNTSVATVSGTGNTAVVTAVGYGTTQVFYTVGSLWTYTIITVVSPVTAGSSAVCGGDTLTVHDATNGGNWSVSNSNASIAMLSGSDSAMVTGLVAGTTTVTYTFGACNQVYPITVNAALATPITGGTNVCKSSTLALSNTTGGGTWSSAATAIATVNASGVVTGIRAGSALIKYMVGSCYVTENVMVDSNTIAAIGGGNAVCTGSTLQLTDATDGSTGNWSISNTNATINSDGLVTGVTAGSATVTYTDHYCYVTSTVTVSTNTLNPITGSAHMCVNGTDQLAETSTGGTWSLSNTAAATINPATGLITPIATPLVAHISGTGSFPISSYPQYTTALYTTAAGCFASYVVTIDSTLGLLGSSITGSSSVCVGSGITLSDTYGGSATWSETYAGTTNPATIARISSTQSVLTGVTAGTVSVSYAYLGGCTATPLSVTINPIPAAISGSTPLCYNTTASLSSATLGGTWTLSNAAAASITTLGVITGSTSAGADTVTYTANGCYTTAVVTNNTIPQLYGGDSVCTGLTMILEDVVPGGLWFSSNPTVATVSSGGITAVSPGTTTISYTVGSCSVTKVISVNQNPDAIAGTPILCSTGSTTLSETSTGGTWSAGGVLSITAGGIVTASGAGTGVVTYAIGQCARTINVTASGAPSAIIAPMPYACVSSGGGGALGSTTTMYDTTVGGTWSCSNPIWASINLVDSGSGSGSSYVSSTGYSNQVAIQAYNVVGTVTISYTNAAGCSATQVVTINPYNAGAITTTYGAMCTGTSVTFTESVSGGTWTSADASIASVNPTTGVVTAISAGHTSIFYTTASNCQASSPDLEVSTTPGAITSSAAGVWTTCVGDTAAYLSCTPAGGSWSTDDEHIASINSNGVLTGYAVGSTTVTYSYGSCQSYAPYTVTANPIAAVSVGGSTTAPFFVCVGGAPTFVALTDATAGVTWASGNTSVATIATGGVVSLNPVAAGTVTIYAIKAGCYQTATVNVNATIPAAITGTLSVCVGDVTTLSDATAGGTWKSTTTTKATISGGAVTGVASGTSVISYSYEGCTVTKTVTVNTNPVTAITYTAPLFGSYPTVCTGTATAFGVTTSGGAGTWSTSSASMATVDASGNVTGVSGSHPILTYTDNTTNCYYALTLAVNPTPSAISGFTPICKGLYGLYFTDATPLGTWSATNANAGVTSAGEVYGNTAATVDTIMYTVNNCAASYIITVNAALPAIGATHASICETAGTGLFTSTSLSNATAGGTWSISDATKASLSATTGSPITMTASMYGTPTITYQTSTGCFVTKNIAIGAQPDALTQMGGTAISATTNMCTGGTFQFVDDSAGGTWTSSAAAVASVSSGFVTALTTGTTVISYGGNGCGYVTATVSVNATPSPITSSYYTSFSMCESATDSLIDTTSAGAGTWSISPSTATITAVTVGSNNYGVISGATATGLYTVSYTVNGCAATQNIYVSACTREANMNNGSATDNSQVYTLFPNPSNGNINIMQTVADDVTMNVEVVNTIGSVVYSGNLQFANGNAQMNVTQLAGGIYMIHMADSKGNVQTFKMVIEK